MTDLNIGVIAPCGMNCGTCMAFLRPKNKCSGCNSVVGPKVNHCSKCAIRFCPKKERPADFCSTCAEFPCKRMKQLDKRYRERYQVSLIANLEKIKEIGLKQFLTQEDRHWACSICSQPTCVHNKRCYFCEVRK